MTCFSSFFAKLQQKMKKNTSWKFTDESSITFQLSISGPGEFGLTLCTAFGKYTCAVGNYTGIFTNGSTCIPELPTVGTVGSRWYRW